MRKLKLLFALLAVLTVFSCLPAFFAGVSAEESEAPAVSYEDPRENATKVYYALAGNLKATDESVLADDEFDAANVINSGTNIWGVLCNDKVMKKSFEPGSVLVVKFKGSLTAFADGTNVSLRKSYNNFFGAATIFRSDNTKLPIIIEGVEVNRASTVTISPSSSSILAFANDYYFTNLTLQKAASTSDVTLHGGSGRVTFDNVNFDLSGNVKFGADNYNADCFYEWTDVRIEANKGKDGLIESSFTFGKDAALPTSSSSGIIISTVVCNGHNGSGNFKSTYLAKDSAFDETVAETVKTYAAAQRFIPGSKNLVTSESKCSVYPTMTKASIIIDNGKANSDTADFGNIYFRRGCNAVGASEIKILSGNVNNVYLDAYTQSDEKTQKEIYYGDIHLVVDGGKIVTRVYGLRYAYLVGNYTAELKSGYIKRFDGTDCTAAYAALNGNYLFHATGGTMHEYYGACEVIGEGNTIETRVEGGTFTSAFNCVRHAVANITNNISGGTFKSNFRTATANTTAGGNVITNVSGAYNETVFESNFYAGAENAGATLKNVVTNISGGTFAKLIKGTSTDESNVINVISENATDSIKLGSYTYTFDKFEMNGGIVHFYKSTVTANNASGSVTVRNTGAWEEGKTYFTFDPAEGKTLNVTTTEHPAVVTRGQVKVLNGKYLVIADTRVAPLGASLILTERIAVKFVFDKAAVDAIGKDAFECAVLLNDMDIAAASQLVEDGNTYTLTTLGIGLPDANTQFTLCGEYVKDSSFTIASLAEAAEQAWEGDWKNWAIALQNLIGVVVDGDENTLSPAEKDYGTYTATKDGVKVTGGTANLVMNSAVGVELNLTCATLPTTPVVKVNGKEIAGVYAADGNNAVVTLYFAPQAMEKTFTVQLFDGEAEIFSLDASVACFAKALGTDAGNALLSYVQATTVVAGK